MKILKPIEKWNPLSAPGVSSIVEYFNVMLETTWPITSAGFQLFFMLDALVVLSVMEHFFPDKKDDPSFPALMRPIEFLVLTIYAYFMKYQERGYVTPVMQYYTTLQDITCLAPLLKKTQINNIREILHQQITLAVALHRPESVTPKIEVRREYEMSILNLIHMVDEKTFPSLFKKLQLNLNKLHRLQASQNIQAPDVMLKYVYTFLCSWFGIWFPITLWSIAGFQSTLFLYPWFMYILWGPSIHRYWLGNPWNDKRVYRESDHTQWPDMFNAKIDEMLMF